MVLCLWRAYPVVNWFFAFPERNGAKIFRIPETMFLEKLINIDGYKDGAKRCKRCKRCNKRCKF